MLRNLAPLLTAETNYCCGQGTVGLRTLLHGMNETLQDIVHIACLHVKSVLHIIDLLANLGDDLLCLWRLRRRASARADLSHQSWNWSVFFN